MSWGIPLLFVLLMAVVAGLGGLGLIRQSVGVAALGGLLLLLLLFFVLRASLRARQLPSLRPWVVAFGCAWVIILGAQLYFAVFVGKEVYAGPLGVAGTTSLPLRAQGTKYDLVVEGSFTQGAENVGREGGYTLSLGKDGQKSRDFTGVFSEHWGRQRLGRRGSAPVRQLQTHVLHTFTSPGQGTYLLQAVRVDPQLTPTLNVTLYQDAFPEKTLWLLSGLLLVAAYGLDRVAGDKEMPVVLVAASALAFVVTFRHLGVPPHTYRNLVGAVLIAAIVGPLAGWIFQFFIDAISRGTGLSYPAVAGRGHGAGRGGK